jgi:hypothetical protein
VEALTSIEKREGLVKVEDLCHYTKVQFQLGHAFARQLTQCNRDKYKEEIYKPVFKLPITRQA